MCVNIVPHQFCDFSLLNWLQSQVKLCAFVFSVPGAEVREVDLKAMTGGIVHTKLWVVDQKHFYVGSANMDWRSLSQVKTERNVHSAAIAAVSASVRGMVRILCQNSFAALQTEYMPLWRPTYCISN